VGAHVANNSGNVEWFTPGPIVEAARAAMGGIDLDPASCAEANRVVRASSYFTAEQNGLYESWSGRLWMNPPYASSLVSRFVGRLCESYSSGTVTQACVLTNNATETKWFQHLAAHAAAMCLIGGRVRFWHPDRDTLSPLQGQVVVYLGGRVKQFTRAFSPLGIITSTTIPVTATDCAMCNAQMFGTRADAIYCSNACRQRAHRLRRQAQR
jgi:ParB family chromosome partitioning protein